MVGESIVVNIVAGTAEKVAASAAEKAAASAAEKLAASAAEKLAASAAEKTAASAAEKTAASAAEKTAASGAEKAAASAAENTAAGTAENVAANTAAEATKKTVMRRAGEAAGRAWNGKPGASLANKAVRRTAIGGGTYYAGKTVVAATSETGADVVNYVQSVPGRLMDAASDNLAASKARSEEAQARAEQHKQQRQAAEEKRRADAGLPPGPNAGIAAKLTHFLSEHFGGLAMLGGVVGGAFLAFTGNPIVGVLIAIAGLVAPQLMSTGSSQTGNTQVAAGGASNQQAQGNGQQMNIETPPGLPDKPVPTRTTGQNPPTQNARG